MTTDELSKEAERLRDEAQDMLSSRPLFAVLFQALRAVHDAGAREALGNIINREKEAYETGFIDAIEKAAVEAGYCDDPHLDVHRKIAERIRALKIGDGK